MYTTQEKTIYAGLDGRRFDPLEVRRRLTIHTGGDLHELLTVFNDGTDLDSAQAEDKLVPAARVAFNFKAAVEGGTTDATVLEYLAHYLEWLSRPSVTNTATLPKTPPCTDCQPPQQRTTVSSAAVSSTPTASASAAFGTQ